MRLKLLNAAQHSTLMIEVILMSSMLHHKLIRQKQKHVTFLILPVQYVLVMCFVSESYSCINILYKLQQIGKDLGSVFNIFSILRHFKGCVFRFYKK